MRKEREKKSPPVPPEKSGFSGVQEEIIMASASSTHASKITIQDITYVAMYLALFFVLDWLSNTLPLFRMPQGGTLGLGTVALLMASYQLGWRLGLLTSVLSILLQFVTGQMYLIGFIQFLLDYFFAFSVYGLACLFPNFRFGSKVNLFYSGVLITNVIRFFSSTASGVFFYETPFVASMAYQATYMVPTLILDLIMVPLLVAALGRRVAMKGIRD